MKKILITGASSFLGWNICELTAAEHEVHGFVFEHSANRQEITEHAVDLSDLNAIDQQMEIIQPDLIIHTAAYSKPDLCQKFPHTSTRINVDATLHLAHHASNLNTPFIFTSTDLVFDGLKGNYSEEDAPNPISIYGEHKLLAEHLTMEVHPSALICRCPLMYGYSGTRNQSYITNLIEKMKNGEEVLLFTDEFRSQALGSDVAAGIMNLINQHCSGIYHLGGPECISRYDFGLLVQESFALTEANITPSLQQNVASIPPRPPDVCLDISKAANIGYKPKNPVEGIKALCKTMNPS